MPSYKEAFPSVWLKKEDVRDSGPQILMIANVTMQDVQRDGEMKRELQLHFDFLGNEKQMTLNFGNAAEVGLLFGEDYLNWIGQSIMVYFDPNVMFGGKKTGGLKVCDPNYPPVIPQPRPPMPQNAPQYPQPPQAPQRPQNAPQQQYAPSQPQNPQQAAARQQLPTHGNYAHPVAQPQRAPQPVAAYPQDDESDPFGSD